MLSGHTRLTTVPVFSFYVHHIVVSATALLRLQLHFILYLPFCPSANSERTDQGNSGTSSSNESVSSLPLRDVNSHNNYAATSPQKSKRGIYQVLKNNCGRGRTNFTKNL
jgi:hypothetical protein